MDVPPTQTRLFHPLQLFFLCRTFRAFSTIIIVVICFRWLNHLDALSRLHFLLHYSIYSCYLAFETFHFLLISSLFYFFKGLFLPLPYSSSPFTSLNSVGSWVLYTATYIESNLAPDPITREYLRSSSSTSPSKLFAVIPRLASLSVDASHSKQVAYGSLSNYIYGRLILPGTVRYK